MIPPLLSSLDGHLVPIATVVIAIGILASYVLSYRRLRHIPGPALAHWSCAWMFRACLAQRQAEIYRPLNRRYGGGGPLVRIGPNDLLTSSPALIRRMSAARSAYGRSSWYATMRMDPYDESLFSTLDTAAHDALKARMAAAYGGRENPRLEADAAEQLQGFVDYIRGNYLSADAAEGGEGPVQVVFRPLDFARAAQFFTLDTVTKIAYGKAFGYLTTDSDMYGYMESAEEQVPLLVLLAEVPFLGRIVLSSPWFLKQIGPKKTDMRGMGKMLKVAGQVVSQRFGPEAKDQRDMLGSFVRRGVSQRQCETQIIAGSDTTATAIRGTMLYLTTTPHAYARLQGEIDTAVSTGAVSSPVKVEEAKKLPYLQAVIYEGLRLQIPFSGLLMKRAPPEGDTFDGVWIPGGTRIAHNTGAVQRDPDVFGVDAELFRPERWLGIGAERRSLMINTVELVFGYGRWGSAGKAVAFLELNTVYVELLRNFDFQLIDPLHPWVCKNSNMFFQSDMWVKATDRKRASG